MPKTARRSRATRAAAAAAAFAVLATMPAAHSSPVSVLHTPDACIRLNHGDYNACNLGNSGGGDRPYQLPSPYTPDLCISINNGDYYACNFGNSGRGDLPYPTN
jgi:roadblock/LC7 domain-containing protein